MSRALPSALRAVMAVLVVMMATPVAGQQAAQRQRLGSIEEAIRAGSALSGRAGPRSVNWIDEGARFSFTTVNPTTRQPEIRRYDPARQRDELLVDRPLTLPGTDEPFRYDEFTFGADSRFLLFQSNFRPIYRHSGIADFYLYSLEGDTIRRAVTDARTAELSPNGSLIGYERGGDLYVIELASGRERRLTDSANDTIFNGVFDWVYEEEFGLVQAWAWSPDNRRIAFWQTEEGGVPFVQLTDYGEQHPEWVHIAYPKVGDHNPVVRIGVADVGTGQVRFLDTGLAEEHYIPRIYWTSDPNTLAVVTLNRLQNHLRLFFFDVRTGERRQVMEERSEAWIDVFDFFAGIDHFFYFPEGIREFFWISDRDGWQHIYRYAYDGRLLNQVTSGDWVVTRVEGIDVDDRTIYYVSTERSPLERHLYSIRFDGSRKRRLTQQAGTHSIDMSPSTDWYIDTWSSTTQHRTVELWSTEGNGRRVAVLGANNEIDRWLETHEYSPLELFSFTTSDGQRLDGGMIKPPGFDPGRRYPVVLTVYGGPGSQDVYNAFESTGWHQYLAQQGYLVVSLNNRGNGNYGRDFMEIVYEDLGRWESNDFAEAARWLGRQTYVDAERIAIHGTSYGGYAAIYTMLAHPGVFSVGIANSPVTDWRLYDTIYTERYMGLLGPNAEGYARASTLNKVDRLEGHLLLIHSAMDENVHPQNTMQLLTALTSAGKDAELRFYPPGAHGAAYDFASYVTMLEVYTNTLCENILPGCQPLDLNADQTRPAS
ncbi:MAG TPA: S9 family peptidase [Longimicrobiales bacterium]|nr:S9 family peptidase [Longimicrobiales bacterium]